MTAREWLDHVRSCASALEGLQRELSGLVCARDECLPWATGSAGGGSRTHSDPTATQAQGRIEGLERMIADTRERMESCERVVGECLRMLDAMRRELGARHAEVLELYYVDCADTWSEVAWEMGAHRNSVGAWRDEAFAWIDAHCARYLL